VLNIIGWCSTKHVKFVNGRNTCYRSPVYSVVMTQKHIEVLVVEDNAADAFLIRKALAREPFPITIHVAADGDQAMEMLIARRCDPDLVILDLNLPKLSGLSLLERTRPHVPVVVFSSSARSDEIQRSYELGVRDFVTKPHDLDSFKREVSYIVRRWGTDAEESDNGKGAVFDR
jgi:DNA-binding response OmpR family regulator